MSGAIFTCKEFRKIWQLIIEWILALITIFTLPIGLYSIFSPSLTGLPLLLVGLATGYLFYKLFIVGSWTRRRIEVHREYLKIGGKTIPWQGIRDMKVVQTRLEAGLIIGQDILSYEEVAILAISLKDGRLIELRLKSSDLYKFSEALKTVGLEGLIQ